MKSFLSSEDPYSFFVYDLHVPLGKVIPRATTRRPDCNEDCSHSLQNRFVRPKGLFLCSEYTVVGFGGLVNSEGCNQFPQAWYYFVSSASFLSIALSAVSCRLFFVCAGKNVSLHREDTEFALRGSGCGQYCRLVFRLDSLLDRSIFLF